MKQLTIKNHLPILLGSVFLFLVFISLKGSADIRYPLGRPKVSKLTASTKLDDPLAQKENDINFIYDGLDTTWWSGYAKKGAPNIIDMRLAQAYTIEAVQIVFPDDYARDFDVILLNNNKEIHRIVVKNNVQKTYDYPLNKPKKIDALKLELKKGKTDTESIDIGEINLKTKFAPQGISSFFWTALHSISLLVFIFLLGLSVVALVQFLKENPKLLNTSFKRLLTFIRSYITLKNVLLVVLFMFFSLYRFFSDLNFTQQGYLNITDSGIPFYPFDHFKTFLTAIKTSMAFGHHDTEWQLLVKGLPLSVLFFITQNILLSIKIYLSLVIFTVMVSFYYALKKLGISFYVAAAFAILWGLMPQMSHWIVNAPNVCLAYAGIPLLLVSTISITEKSTSSRFHFPFFLGFSLMFLSDPSYAYIGMWAFVISLPLLLIRKSRPQIKTILVTISLSVIPAILFISIFYSGLIANYFTGGTETYATGTYTKDVIHEILFQSSPSSTLVFGMGRGVSLVSDANNAKIILYLGILLLGLFFTKKKPSIRIFYVLLVVGFVLTLGTRLPYWEPIYDFFYSLPGAFVLRNIFKLNFLFILSVFILVPFTVHHLIETVGEKNKLVKVVAAFMFLGVAIYPFINTGMFYLKELVFKDLPPEYYELRDFVQQDSSDFRIFYYPLHNPVATETNTWQTDFGVSHPYISAATNKPNNLYIPVGDHPHSIDIYNILSNNLLTDRYGDFFKSLGGLSYKYFIFRNDLPPGIMPPELYLQNIEYVKALKQNGHQPVFENSIFTVFQVPDKSFVPIISTPNPTTTLFGSHNNVVITLKEKKTQLMINTKNETTWYISQPLVNGAIGRQLAKLHPLLFGTPVKTAEVVACDQANADHYVNFLKLRNCFEFSTTKNDQTIIVNPAIDMYSITLKLVAFVLFVLYFWMLRMYFGRTSHE